jgi:hypothetical protein
VKYLLWDHGAYHSNMSSLWFGASGAAALFVAVTWKNRKDFRKLDAAANGH